MKKLLLGHLSSAFFIYIILFNISCSKNNSTTNNNTNNNPSTSNVFFKITFNGVTLQTDGINSSDNNINLMYKSFCSATVTTLPSLNESDLQINISGSSINAQLNNKSQSVDAILHFKKSGGGIGNYNIPEQPGAGAIYDIRLNRITYLVDDNSGQINISSIDANYIYGTFSINLISNNNLIPATGSFKLNKQ